MSVRAELIWSLILVLAPLVQGAGETADLASLYRQGADAELQALDYAGLDPTGRALVLRSLLRTGQYERVLQLVPAPAAPGGSESPLADPLLVWRMDALQATGAAVAALDLARRCDATLPVVARRWRLLRQLGQRREAQALAMQAIARHRQRARADDADPLLVMAYAACLAERDPQTAFSLTTALGEREPPALDGRVQAGLICLERFQWGYAEEEFAAVLEQNPRHPDALFGLALVREAMGQKAEALAGLEQVLAVNPRHADALLAKARLALLDGRDDQAAVLIDLIATFNKEHQAALSLLAASFDRAGRGDQRDRQLQVIRTQNPAPVDSYLLLAEIAHADGRLPAALAWSEKAAELVPGHWQADYLAGLALLLQGKDLEAERRLLRSFDANDFNIWAYNLLTILEIERDEATTARFAGERFELFCPRGPAELLWPFLAHWLDDSIERLAAHFAVPAPTDGAKLRIVLCADEEELAARTGHLPGFVGNARGFGHVVVVRIPEISAGAWPWYTAIEYGLAESFALQAGAWNLPPWLRRGLAWRALRPARPADALPLQAAVLDADLPSLGERIDAGDESMARQRGELLARLAHAFIDEELQADQVPALCQALARGESLPQVWETIVGATLADSEQGFRERLAAATRASPVVVPLSATQLDEHGRDADGLEPWLRLRLAVTWLDRGNYDAARAILEPLAEQPELAAHAFGQLARLAWAQHKDSETSTAMLVEAFERDEQHFGSLLLGAVIAREQSENEIAELFLAKLLEAHPRVVAAGPQPRLLLADLRKKQGRQDEVLRLLREQLALAPDDNGAQLRLLREQLAIGDVVSLRPLAEEGLKRWCFAEPALKAALRCYRDAGEQALVLACEAHLDMVEEQRREAARRRDEAGENLQ